MATKKYLKSVEEVLALKNTDTKIYFDFEGADDLFLQFIDGVLCENVKGKFMYVGMHLYLGDKPYILEEEPMQEASEEDIGKLCLFWNVDGVYYIGTLKSIDVKSTKRFYMLDVGYYEYCRRLTPSEVAELTGYKVSFADQSDAKVEDLK